MPRANSFVSSWLATPKSVASMVCGLPTRDAPHSYLWQSVAEWSMKSLYAGEPKKEQRIHGSWVGLCSDRSREQDARDSVSHTDDDERNHATQLARKLLGTSFLSLHNLHAFSFQILIIARLVARLYVWILVALINVASRANLPHASSFGPSSLAGVPRRTQGSGT